MKLWRFSVVFPFFPGLNSCLNAKVEVKRYYMFSYHDSGYLTMIPGSKPVKKIICFKNFSFQFEV